MNRFTNPFLLTLVLIVSVLSACNQKDKKAEDQSTMAPIDTVKTPAYPENPNWHSEPGLYAQFSTPKGTIVCRLEYTKTPMTVGNFVALAEGKQLNAGKPVGQPLYDGLTFHRVIPNFMIQGGDPAGTGTGALTKYSFPDEFDASLRLDGPGVLAMANAGPATNSTQFFITHVTTPWLNDKHTVFGKVVLGQNVVNAIAQGDKIDSVRIVRVGAEAEAFDGLKAYNENVAIATKKAAEEGKLLTMSAAELVKAKYPTAKKTASGLFYVVEKEGTGAQAVAGKTVSVHYTGTLGNGKKFDSSLDRGQPISFALGRGQVIPGWDEGIALMKVGSKLKLIIPSNLGYGSQGAGGVIPPNATLIFDTELMEVK
jgi:FKBP-type peptidyl-prolyl cis-trans isomerase